MSEIEEVSKAVGAVADTAGKVVGAMEKLGAFCSRVLAGPIEETSGIIEDKLKFLRWKRQVRMIEETEKILMKRGVNSTRPVPPKLAIPVLEAASLEENNSIQDLWNKLLANCMDPAVAEMPTLRYVEILKSIEPLDALMLEKIYKAMQTIANRELTRNGVDKEQLMKIININEIQYYESVYSLFRLQCLQPTSFELGLSMGNNVATAFKGAEVISITPLGRKLVELCIK